MANSNTLKPVPDTNNPHEKWSPLFYNLGPNPKRDNTCMVCRDEMEATDKVLYHPNCGNAFHPDCLVGWFDHQTNTDVATKCPLCFAEVESIEWVTELIAFEAQVFEVITNVRNECREFQSEMRYYYEAIAQIERRATSPQINVPHLLWDLRDGMRNRSVFRDLNSLGFGFRELDQSAVSHCADNAVLDTDPDVVRELKCALRFVDQTINSYNRWDRRLSSLLSRVLVGSDGEDDGWDYWSDDDDDDDEWSLHVPDEWLDYH